MITPELLDYIKQQLVTGVSEPEITRTLRENAWMEEDIAEAFKYIRQKNEEDGQKKKINPTKVLIGVSAGFIVFAIICIGFALLQPKAITNMTVATSPQTVNDGQRIADLLTIQKALEDYYGQNKKYPNSLDRIPGLPKTPSGSNYSYTAVGNPAQSYVLAGQMENTSSKQFEIKDGYLTLTGQNGGK